MDVSNVNIYDYRSVNGNSSLDRFTTSSLNPYDIPSSTSNATNSYSIDIPEWNTTPIQSFSVESTRPVMNNVKNSDGIEKNEDEDWGDVPDSPRRKKNEIKTVLFCHHLPKSWNEADLKDFCRVDSDVQILNAEILRDPRTQASRGFGFVTFKDVDSCTRSKSKLTEMFESGKVTVEGRNDLGFAYAKREDARQKTPGKYAVHQKDKERKEVLEQKRKERMEKMKRMSAEEAEAEKKRIMKEKSKRKRKAKKLQARKTALELKPLPNQPRIV
eukprot:TRINITY_DN7900_c0_g1_i1.p1 TRINITY_DN7900_c0_g1~~TRINITY_DN7900_c0_g1_i1.p1  ORF type:complete len:293 (+),score=62.53 TRINITY_DN7900_c0_g1_i1:66-881(+)